MDEQFAGSLGFVVHAIAHGVHGDFAPFKPEFFLLHVRVRFVQGTMPIAEGFDLRPDEHNAAFQAFEQLVLVAGLAIAADHHEGIGSLVGFLRHGQSFRGNFVPRFAILEHDHPTRHWDFFLEADGVLKAWRLESLPFIGQAIAAETAPDHRLLYLDYEGPVSGDRGFVVACDRGPMKWTVHADEQVHVTLFGKVFQGDFRLACVEQQWTLTWVAASSPSNGL